MCNELPYDKIWSSSKLLVSIPRLPGHDVACTYIARNLAFYLRDEAEDLFSMCFTFGWKTIMVRCNWLSALYPMWGRTGVSFQHLTPVKANIVTLPLCNFYFHRQHQNSPYSSAINIMTHTHSYEPQKSDGMNVLHDKPTQTRCSLCCLRALCLWPSHKNKTVFL